ncbi:MAG TPA: HNH endonuclease [Pyrinomonadaceae bacterium]
MEKSENFQDRFRSAELKREKCIYCLSETGKFNSEEHIIAETLGGDELFLPKGLVCDECNNGISSQLDEALLKFEPIAFLSVIHTPYTKKGKLPKANFQNMTVEKKSPNYIEFMAKDKTGRVKNKERLKDGRERLAFKMSGKKLDWKILARTVYKIALGMVAYDYGHEAALDDKYQPARDFILKGGSFNNNMLVTTKSGRFFNLFIGQNNRFDQLGFILRL